MRTSPMPTTQHGVSVRQDRDRFAAFAFANSDILLELDENLQIVFADGATLNLFGKRPEALAGTAFISLLAEEEREAIGQLLLESKPAIRHNRVKLTLQAAAGGLQPCVLSGYRLPTLGGHSFITLSLIRGAGLDIDLNMRDISTGLLKPQAFSEKAAAAIRQGTPLTLSLLDIPELRASESPHALMEELCRYLQQISHGGDTTTIVKEGSFALLMDGEPSPQELQHAVRAIASQHLSAAPKVTTNSMKVESGRISDKDCAHALQYTLNRFATHQGDGFTLRSLAEGYQAMLDETLTRIKAFHHTVESQKFTMALQPIVDIKRNNVHHYEVLARLEDETFANPFDFITFGEKAGIIGEFDLAMCQRTFELLGDLAKARQRPTLAINLSGQSLGSDLFKDTLKEMLKVHQPVRQQVMFEITESARIDDLAKANEFLQQLRRSGNRCCLDDFGVGESSFEYLRQLEVDFVKIDGSYVRDSIATTRGKHLLRAMAALCQDMRIGTIGEMVEDARVAQFLSSCGIGMGQGYYFGKPSTDIAAVLTDAAKKKNQPPTYGSSAPREWSKAPMA